MKLALLGARDGTGQQIVQQKWRQSYGIKALARDPAKLVSGDNLEIIAGSVLDSTAVARPVSGTGAVIWALRPTGNNPDTVTSEGTPTMIITAMQQQGIHRLVVVTTLGVGDNTDSAINTRQVSRDHNLHQILQRCACLPA